MRELVLALAGSETRLPVVLFADGSHLVTPTNIALAEKVGLDTHAKSPVYDLIIVGAGPAGLADAVYGASEGLRTLLIERSAPGGQAGTSSRIENYLGFPAGITGADLAQRAVAQARRFGFQIERRLAFGLDYAETLRRWRCAFLDNAPRARELGFDERFMRIWQFYLAYCEAAFLRGNTDVVQFTLRRH